MPSAGGLRPGEGESPHPAPQNGGACFIPRHKVLTPPAGMSQDYLSANSNGGYGTGKAPLGGWHLTGNILPTPFTPHGVGGGTAATPCPLVRMNPLGLPPCVLSAVG